MKSTATAYRYIEIDENSVPIIEGTSMKVVELITSIKAYNWGPEELLQNYPHLTLSKIYSALGLLLGLPTTDRCRSRTALSRSRKSCVEKLGNLL